MTLPANVQDRTFVSQYANDTVGIVIHIGGVPADPDNQIVTATMIAEATSTTVFVEPAIRTDVGVYEIIFTSAQTQNPGDYTIRWSFSIGATPEGTATFVEIGPSSPAYDALDPGMKALVENVWLRFKDCFDSPCGGLNLGTYFQSNWSRGRMAQLLGFAVGILNTTAQPHQSYTIGGPGEFPLAQWGPLLEQSLLVEALKHLTRSYTEDPIAEGVTTARMNRRDYVNRWRDILVEERAQLKEQLDVFKVVSMNLGSGGRVLVSGGVFGNFGSPRYLGGAGRPRFAYRWF
jgi:hypothetical protein